LHRFLPFPSLINIFFCPRCFPFTPSIPTLARRSGESTRFTHDPVFTALPEVASFCCALAFNALSPTGEHQTQIDNSMHTR
jgi:hypothetical protein